MIEQIHPSQFADWLTHARARGQPLLLDVREPMEWAAASVEPEGCEVRLLSMYDVPPRLAELDPDRPVACLCHHGVRSMQVAAYLVQHGFEQVANIVGGIDAWARDFDPGVPRY